MVIDYNAALQDLEGLSKLASVGDVYIYRNAALKNLDELSRLTSVGWLVIEDNDALTDVDGLATLSSVEGNLSIGYNAALTNLDGLSGLTSVRGDLDILDNAELNQCNCGLFSLLDSEGAAGSITIAVNAPGCNSQAEILAQGACAVPTMPQSALPTHFALAQNYPNPFNPHTRIAFDVPQAGPVTLTVYDVLGRAVAVLASRAYAAGWHEVVWEAAGVPSGVYVYRLEAEGTTVTKTMLLHK